MNYGGALEMNKAYLHRHATVMSLLVGFVQAGQAPSLAPLSGSTTFSPANVIHRAPDTDCNSDGRPDEFGVVDSCLVKTLTGHSVFEGSGFGASLAIHGDVAVFGQPFREPWNPVSGIEVFRLAASQWNVETVLFPSTIESVYWMGTAVAVSSEYVFFNGQDRRSYGAPYRNCVYVFRHVNGIWAEESPVCTVSNNDDYFGRSIAVDGDRLVIGAPEARGSCPLASAPCGAVHVFRRGDSGWELEGILEADGVRRLGAMVDSSGPRIVASKSGGGAICTFERGAMGWAERTPLRIVGRTPDGSGEELLPGEALSLNRDVLVSGEPHSIGYGNQGVGGARVYRYDGSTWRPEFRFEAPVAAFQGGFGTSVALGEDMFAGGPLSVACGPPRGTCRAVQVFRRQNGAWAEAEALVPPGVGFDSMYSGLAISGTNLLVGIPEERCTSGSGHPYCGAVHAYSLGGLDCNCNGTSDQCEIALEIRRDLDGNGLPDDCDAPELLGDPIEIPASRYLTLGLSKVSSVHSMSVALAVIPSMLYSPAPDRFGDLVGATWWVGPPIACEDPVPMHGMQACAMLQEDPYYFDWRSVEAVHVTGAGIIPSSTYRVASFGRSCWGEEAACEVVSESLHVETSSWGNVVPPTGGAADFADVAMIVDSFRGIAPAYWGPLRPRTQLQPNVIDPRAPVSLLDVSAGVEAIRGGEYPFDGPARDR